MIFGFFLSLVYALPASNPFDAHLELSKIQGSALEKRGGSGSIHPNSHLPHPNTPPPPYEKPRAFCGLSCFGNNWKGDSISHAIKNGDSVTYVEPHITGQDKNGFKKNPIGESIKVNNRDMILALVSHEADSKGNMNKKSFASVYRYADPIDMLFDAKYQSQIPSTLGHLLGLFAKQYPSEAAEKFTLIANKCLAISAACLESVLKAAEDAHVRFKVPNIFEWVEWYYNNKKFPLMEFMFQEIIQKPENYKEVRELYHQIDQIPLKYKNELNEFKYKKKLAETRIKQEKKLRVSSVNDEYEIKKAVLHDHYRKVIAALGFDMDVEDFYAMVFDWGPKATRKHTQYEYEESRNQLKNYKAKIHELQLELEEKLNDIQNHVDHVDKDLSEINSKIDLIQAKEEKEKSVIIAKIQDLIKPVDL